jgi:predicted DNA-binding transcriptional regulator AlpA
VKENRVAMGKSKAHGRKRLQYNCHCIDVASVLPFISAMGFLFFQPPKNYFRREMMVINSNSTSDVLTRKQAAEYLKISRGTLDKLDIPRIQIRRRAVYRKADIDQWLESRKVGGVTA